MARETGGTPFGSLPPRCTGHSLPNACCSLPAVRNVMLHTRAISSIGVVLVGVVPALFGPWGVAVAFAALGLLALHEIAAMLALVGYPLLWPIAAPVLVLSLVAVAAGWPLWTLTGLVALAVLLPGAVIIFRPTLDGTLATWVGTVFTTLFVTVPLTHIALVRALSGVTTGAGTWLTRLETALGVGSTARGMAWFLFALVTVWLTDVGAYAVGRAAGRHPLIPVVSPKKTWEGLGGGLVAGGVAASLSNSVFGLGMVLPIAFLAGIALAGIATVGDLAESLLKRQTGVKDSGTLIPGHGGVLDRLDSQLYVFVAVYYLARLIG